MFMKGKVFMLNFIRRAKWSYIGLSIVIAVMGICCIAFPSQVSSFLGWIIGIAAIVLGIIRLIIYFSYNKQGIGFDFSVGVILICTGIFFLTCWNLILSALAVVAGVILIFDSILKIQSAIDCLRIKYKQWWVGFLIALVVAAGGIVLICVPFKAVDVMFRVLGAVLVLDAVQNLYSVINASVFYRNLSNEAGEVEVDCIDVR